MALVQAGETTVKEEEIEQTSQTTLSQVSVNWVSHMYRLLKLNT